VGGSGDAMGDIVQINDEVLDSAIQHYHPSSKTIRDIEELRYLRLFPKLRSADFSGTNLDDTGLLHVSTVPWLDWLDLQETSITNEGLGFLGSLPKLWYLRLKGNDQLTNDCVPRLLRLQSLVNLQIQDTRINQEGVKDLVGLRNLRDLCVSVWGKNFTFEGLLEVSRRMPACKIVAKGNGEFHEGRFEGMWRG
jgi:hypothetical protein